MRGSGGMPIRRIKRSCSACNSKRGGAGFALATMARGETLTAIARSYNVSHMTIGRLVGVAIMQ